MITVRKRPGNRAHALRAILSYCSRMIRTMIALESAQVLPDDANPRVARDYEGVALGI